MYTQPTKRNRVVASLALVALTGAITATAFAFPANPIKQIKKTVHTIPVAAVHSKPAVVQTAVTTSEYKDGTYTANGHYFSPDGKEGLTVSITLDQGMVTDAQVKQGANDPTAVSYQELFISGYKSKVVGKKLNSIHLTNVSGSSLTSQGFNSAVSKIKQEAKA